MKKILFFILLPFVISCIKSENNDFIYDLIKNKFPNDEMIQKSIDNIEWYKQQEKKRKKMIEDMKINDDIYKEKLRMIWYEYDIFSQPIITRNTNDFFYALDELTSMILYEDSFPKK